MTSPRPDDFPLEWLAAYADGELTSSERARVERWLSDNPEARELLETQESLGPDNTEFWRAARPAEPSPDQWSTANDEIGGAIPVSPRTNWTGWLGTIGLVAMAASLLLLLPGPDHRCPNMDGVPEAPCEPAPSFDDEPFPIASADDVRILSLPESAANLLVAGDHPLRDSMFLLARFGEIEFHGIGSDLAGRFPEMPNDPKTEEIPMIWAPREP
jgi:hypothetical protein